MNVDEINQSKKAIAEGIFRVSDAPAPKGAVAPIFAEIIKYNEESIGAAIGEMGLRVRNFAINADLTHPDVFGLITPEDSDCLMQLLRLGKFMAESGLTKLSPFIEIPREMRERLKGIDSPLKNHRLVRFLKDGEKRGAARAAKDVIKIEIYNLYKRDLWQNLIDSFALYVRYNKSGESEIAKAQHKMKVFSKFQLTCLNNEIAKSIDIIKSQLIEDYFGFHRITMTSVAVMLAKIHNFQFSFKEDSRILVAREFLGIPGLDRQHVYQPRAYPVHALWNVASDFTKKVVGHLESSPELGGRAMFDHYVVIVPTIQHGQNSKGCGCEVCVANRGGKNGEEKQRAIDLRLIAEKKVCPVMLGERNGKCYFISYFD